MSPGMSGIMSGMSDQGSDAISCAHKAQYSYEYSVYSCRKREYSSIINSRPTAVMETERGQRRRCSITISVTALSLFEIEDEL